MKLFLDRFNTYPYNKHMTIKAYELAMLTTLKELSENGLVQLSYNQLVELTGWNIKTVINTMKGLVATGKIQKVSGGVNRTATTYRVKEVAK